MAENKHTKDDLKILQALPLDLKILKTKQRIREWVSYWGENGVYVSFSGGKDSTVLLHIVRELYPNIEAVFVNTGLEYPEIQKFVKGFDNITILRPEMQFGEVITKYGYPMISKDVAECVYNARRSLELGNKNTYRLRQLFGEAKDKYGNKSMFNHEKYQPLLYVDFIIGSSCCNVMKKKPLKIHGKKTDKKPMTAQTATESLRRETTWLKNGCNGFNMKSPVSNPMSFWTEQDILQYIKQYSLPICSVYGDIIERSSRERERERESCQLCTSGCRRTGCIFCGFGAHMDKKNNPDHLTRFQMLKETHPRQYDYCINGGEYNESGLWVPSKEGLGMAHVFDELNKLYGEDFIRYK